jgi:ParB/RepB/Spo0J family partition protein
MTSGQFHTFPLDSIIIHREGRQRRELKGIPELADSIQRLGLFHPLIITRDGVLVSGERRTVAMKSLGWTHAPVQFVDEIDPAILHLIELEENIKREDLDWRDRVRAVQDYHLLRKSNDPTWTQHRTAEAIGLKQATVSELLQVANEVAKGNARVMAAPKLSTAVGIVGRAQSRAIDSEAAKIAGSGMAPSVSDRTIPDTIIVADFNEWAPLYDGPKFNLLHCDFPYGIGADDFHQGGAAAHGGYDDSEDTYWRLCGTLADNLDRLCAESCHLVFWFSMKFYKETLDVIRNMGWVCDGFPLIWLKSDNIGTLPDPERGPRRLYETAFFASRGDRKIVSPVSNAYAAPTDRSIHMSAKPEPVLRHFFRMLVDEHTRLLDPTAGSGTSLRAAESLSASYALGLEVDPEFASRAREALERNRAKAAIASV